MSRTGHVWVRKNAENPCTVASKVQHQCLSPFIFQGVLYFPWSTHCPKWRNVVLANSSWSQQHYPQSQVVISPEIEGKNSSHMRMQVFHRVISLQQTPHLIVCAKEWKDGGEEKWPSMIQLPPCASKMYLIISIYPPQASEAQQKLPVLVPPTVQELSHLHPLPSQL